MRNRGQSLVEVLIAVAIGTILITAAIAVIAPALKTNSDVVKAQTAGGLTKELMDGVKSVAQGDWYSLSSLTAGQNYYLKATSSPFVVLQGVQSIAVSSTTFNRYFIVQNVNRDAGGKIVESGGSDDPSTKKITVGVSWARTATTTISTYLTRSRNKIYIQTDWSGGPGYSGPASSTNFLYWQASAQIVTTSTGSIILNLSTSTP